jgi:hypothetical protein
VPEVFAPDLISTELNEGCSGFLLNGTVFVFSRMEPDSDWRYKDTYVTELVDGAWTEPVVAPFSVLSPYNFTVAPDDETLYFTSIRDPNDHSVLLEQSNIWTVRKTDDGWTEPVMLDESINTDEFYENYPTIDRAGTIYYMSRRPDYSSRSVDAVGGTDIYFSRFEDGRYLEAENAGNVINTADADQDPFVAPDGSYLIVCLTKEEGFGEYDLYISFRTEGGSWTPPLNMGEAVNSPSYEFRPYVTPGGRYFFFTSDRPGGPGDVDIYWMDAGIIDTLRAEAGG